MEKSINIYLIYKTVSICVTYEVLNKKNQLTYIFKAVTICNHTCGLGIYVKKNQRIQRLGKNLVNGSCDFFYFFK